MPSLLRTIFCTSIAEGALRSFSYDMVGACRGGSPRLDIGGEWSHKAESYHGWLVCGLSGAELWGELKQNLGCKFG